jgi:hypothetical protein
MVKTAIRYAEFLAALCAAILWFWSARIAVPQIDLHWNGEAPEFFKALSLQSRLSAYAAISAGFAVFCQIAQSFTGAFPKHWS